MCICACVCVHQCVCVCARVRACSLPRNETTRKHCLHLYRVKCKITCCCPWGNSVWGEIIKEQNGWGGGKGVGWGVKQQNCVASLSLCKDSLPDRHSCLKLYPCVIKFKQSLAPSLFLSLTHIDTHADMQPHTRARTHARTHTHTHTHIHTHILMLYLYFGSKWPANEINNYQQL